MLGFSFRPYKPQLGFSQIFSIIGVLILLVGIGVAVYLTQFTQIFKPKASGQNICYANSVKTLQDCITSISTGPGIDTIEVLNLILCDDVTPEKRCEFKLENINRPITIRGGTNSGAGFRRVKSVNAQLYTYFYISRSSNITIQNLFFDDLTHNGCGANGISRDTGKIAWSVNQKCNAHAITVWNSPNVTLDGLAFLYSPTIAVTAYNADNLQVVNSKMIDSGQVGVWIAAPDDPARAQVCDGDCTSSSIHVDRNLFIDTSTEAVLFNGNGVPGNPATLNNNLFVHTHQRDMYNTGGGTLNLFPLTHTEIKGNVIKGNKIENRPDLTSGAAEMQMIDNTVITGNSIHDNSGGGIATTLTLPEGPGSTAARPLPPGFGVNTLIAQNKLYNNNNEGRVLQGQLGEDINFPFTGTPPANAYLPQSFINTPPFVLSTLQQSNCESPAACTAFPSVKLGKIYADPAGCFLENNKCKTTLKWFTNDATNQQVKVTANGVVADLSAVSANPDGQAADIDWIGPNGAKFDLYVDGIIIDSVFVKASDGSPVAPPTQDPSTPPVDTGNTIHQVLITGQSLAAGYGGTPPVSTTQPYNNLMLTDSFANFWNPNNPSTTFAPLTALLAPDLVEPKLVSTETIAGGMANWVTAQMQNNYQMLMTVNALGGVKYEGLKKGGTIPNLPTTVSLYNRGLEQAQVGKKLAAAQGKGFSVGAVAVVHGEHDNAAGNGPSYKGYLNEWLRDYNQDLKAITGQNEDIPMIIDQVSSWTMFGLASATAPNSVAIAQHEASEENPDKIYLVGPSYFLGYADGVHLNNQSYRRLGEYYGKVYKKVVIDKQRWVPLSPNMITISGNVITAKLNVPVPPIQVDTTQVVAKENHGFEYYDDSGSPARITQVSIVTGDTLNITLDRAPTGNNKRLRYAFTGTAGSWAGADQMGSARGNIRDSDATQSLYGYNLNNWLVHFDKPIPTTPTTPTAPANTVPIGAFDGIVGSQVIAWACDLDVASAAPIVHIYIDNQFGWADKADKTGEGGIANYCGGFKDRRVITDIPDKYKDGKAHTVHVFVIDNITNGTNTLLQGSPKTFTLQPPPPTGKLTASPNPCSITANQTNCGTNGPQVSWTVTNPTAGVEVKIKSSGQSFAGGALSGTAQAWFITEQEETLELYTGNTLLDSIKLKGVRVNSAPLGYFDGIVGSQLIGWACDLDTASTAPDVHIYVDNQFGWADKADKTGEGGIANYCGGFKDRRVITNIPDKYKDGKAHTVHIFALDNITNGTNTLFNGSPKTFNIAPPPPSGTLTASPNPCQIKSGEPDCRSNPSKISWNVTNPTGDIVVKIRETGQAFAGGALSGTEDAWFPTQAGVTLDLYTGNTVLASVTVKGNPQTTSMLPSPSRKPGDIDGDGDVDVSDYNIMLTDYPSKNLRSDIDGNGRLDIFDVNLLISNFGK